MSAKSWYVRDGSFFIATTFMAISRPLENTSRVEDPPARFVAYINQVDASHLGLAMLVVRITRRAMKRLVAEGFEKRDHFWLRTRIKHEI